MDSFKNIKEKKNVKKGFTLVELLVVIAIIGILVLLAVPSFLGDAEKAKLAQIKNDTKVYDGILAGRMVDKDEYLNKAGYELMDKEKLAQAIKDGKVYTKKGKFTDDYDFSNDVYLLPPGFGNSKLKGDFIYSEDLKEVLYIDKKGSSIEREEEEGVVLAADEDFKFVKYEEHVSDLTRLQKIDGERGYWAYIGKDKRVQIPNEIQGYKVTNAFRMFSGTEVEEVVLNKDMKSINSIFYNSKANRNVLNEGENNSVEDAGAAFMESRAGEINIDNFKGDSLLRIDGMFAKTLDKREIKLSFNSKAISGIRELFYDSSFKEIDISSLDLNKHKTIFAHRVFGESKAEKITLGSNFKELKLTSVARLFENAEVKEVDLENIDMRYVIDAGYMFKYSSLEKIDLSHTSANEVQEINDFANSAEAKEIILPEMDFRKVKNAKQMFFRVNLDKLDLSNLDVSNVGDLSSFFLDSNIRDLKLFDLKKMNEDADINQMFSDFETESVIDISGLRNNNNIRRFLLRAKVGGLYADNIDLKKAIIADFNRIRVYGDLSLKNIDENLGEIILMNSDVIRNKSKKPVITVTSSNLHKIAFDKYNRTDNVDITLLPAN